MSSHHFLPLVLFNILLSCDCQQPWEPHRFRRQDEWSPWEPPWWNYDNSVVVRTVYGDVRGFSVPWHIDDLVYDPDMEENPPWYTRRVNCFLGVPYASPPTGRYRFDRPRKPRWGGLHWDASYYRPACPQDLAEIQRDIPDYPAANVSEDCLYMNVYAPNITYYIGPGHLFPVLIWLHSGDFMTGSAQVHPGQVLATKGIVVVTFNYRLGAFGFLSLQDSQAPGNWGLFDQHMALEFVRENIKAFQGDPDRITLGGDGAGAASVGLHMLSDMTRGKRFFHQCIMMSGSDLAKWAFLDPYWGPRKYALQLAEKLGCPTHDTYRTILCLRDETINPWQKVLNASLEITPQDGPLGIVWAPTQDGGWFVENPIIPQVPYLRYTPQDMRMQGYWDQTVPCIIGLNTQDGTKKANATSPSLSVGISREDMRAYIVSMLRQWGIQDMYLERAVDAIEFQYTYWPEPENRTARTQQFIHMITDLNVGSPMDEVLRQQANHSDTWMYRFNYMSWSDWRPVWMGVSYSAAVPYVFGVPFMNETILNETELVPRQWYDYDDRNMSDWMMYMWTNFIREGHPTPNITRNVTWEPYNLHNLTYLEIDWHSYIWFMYRQDKYSFWREYFPQTAKQEFYYATPTPAGYGYVVATGWMLSIVIVLFCCLGFMAFTIWYLSDLEHQREKHPPPTQSMPLSLRSSHRARPRQSPQTEASELSSPPSMASIKSVPAGWASGGGNTSSAGNYPKGWTVGSTSTGNIPLRNAGGNYFNSDLSDYDEDDGKLQYSPGVGGPDPYSTLDYRPPYASRQDHYPRSQTQPYARGQNYPQTYASRNPQQLNISTGDNRGRNPPSHFSHSVV